jgi:hypothetical protein
MMNRVIILIVVWLLAAGMGGCAYVSKPEPVEQPKTAAPKTLDHENIKRQAQELSEAMVKHDFNRAADLTYPKLIEMMGGRDGYISMAKEAVEEMESQQLRIVSVAVGEPHDIVEVKDEIFAIVPSTMRIKVPDGVFVGEAFMIAVSKDGGKQWTFVDSAAAKEEGGALKTLFPDAADQLRIPEQKRPVFHKGLDR